MTPTLQCKVRGEELQQHEVLQPDQPQSPTHVAQCSPGGHDVYFDHDNHGGYGGHGDHVDRGGHVGQYDK